MFYCNEVFSRVTSALLNFVPKSSKEREKEEREKDRKKKREREKKKEIENDREEREERKNMEKYASDAHRCTCGQAKRGYLKMRGFKA